MPIDFTSDATVCTRCGASFNKRHPNFSQSFADLHKGIGYVPVCKNCVNRIFDKYAADVGDKKMAARQTCRKLDIYWNEDAYTFVEQRLGSKQLMPSYIAKINQNAYIGKTYDDTLIEEGTLWVFDPLAESLIANAVKDDEEQTVSQEIIEFWGSGYTVGMYKDLEQRRAYWMKNLPDDMEINVATEAIIRQICSTELDIIKSRSAGKNADKMVGTLNTLLGSLNLRPDRIKDDDTDGKLMEQPLGVLMYRLENLRPIAEPDPELRDVNHILKYVFTWLGHICKMMGIKNSKFQRLYEEEIARLRVDRPEYDDDDDEDFLMEYMTDEPPGSERND